MMDMREEQMINYLVRMIRMKSRGKPLVVVVGRSKPLIILVVGRGESLIISWVEPLVVVWFRVRVKPLIVRVVYFKCSVQLLSSSLFWQIPIFVSIIRLTNQKLQSLYNILSNICISFLSQINSLVKVNKIYFFLSFTSDQFIMEVLKLTINILQEMQMNSQLNLKPGEDAEAAEKAAQFFKLIQSKIALKSFEGARTILSSQYTRVLLGDDKVQYLKCEVDKAESNYKKDGNRFYWQWYVIFVFSTLAAGYFIWRFGIYEVVLNLLSSSISIAKVIIGATVYSASACIGLAFKHLCQIVKQVVRKIFG